MKSAHRGLLVVVMIAAAACARVPRLRVDASVSTCHRVAPDAATTITWMSPDDSEHRNRLAAWCDAVGPLVYAPHPSQPAPVTNHLLIVSWNAHVGGGNVAALIAAIRRGAFTGGAAVTAFVLLLQEMYRHDDGVPERLAAHAAVARRILHGSHITHSADVRRVAEAEGLALFYAPSMRNGAAPEDPEDRGNAILASLPLIDPGVIELPFERQRRVVPFATVRGVTSEGTAWRLRLANVHLDTSLAIARGGPLIARRRQAEALVDALGSTDEEVATVVAGDFNTFLGPGEPAVRRMRRAFPDAPPPGQANTWRGPFGMHAVLDYVFARGLAGVRVRRVPKRFGSDHFPLIADVRF